MQAHRHRCRLHRFLHSALAGIFVDVVTDWVELLEVCWSWFSERWQYPSLKAFDCFFNHSIKIGDGYRNIQTILLPCTHVILENIFVRPRNTLSFLLRIRTHYVETLRSVSSKTTTKRFVCFLSIWLVLCSRMNILQTCEYVLLCRYQITPSNVHPEFADKWKDDRKKMIHSFSSRSVLWHPTKNEDGLWRISLHWFS